MHTSSEPFISPAAVVRRRSGTGLVLLMLSATLWGTGGLTGSLLSRTADLSPVAVAGYRLCVGGGLIVAFLVLTGRRLPAGRPAWTRIAVLGALAALYQVCYFAAVALTSVSLATLVTIGAAPMLVLAAEAVTGRRPVDRRAAGIAVLALAGLAMLIGLPSGEFGTVAVLSGAGLALVSAAGFAAITLVGARPVATLDDLTATGLGFSAGGLLVALVAGSTVGLGFNPDLRAVGLLLALGVGPTAVAYLLYFRGLRTVRPGTAALLVLLEPLVGALLAALILDDRLGVGGLAGAALLLVAVVLAATSPAQPESTAAAG